MGGTVGRRSVSEDTEMEPSGSNTASRSLESANRKCILEIKVGNGGALRSELYHDNALIPDLRGGWGGFLTIAVCWNRVGSALLT